MGRLRHETRESDHSAEEEARPRLKAAERRPRRRWHALRIAAVVFLSLVLLVVIASFFVDEPLRRTIEKGMNRSLQGYSVQLPKAHLGFLGLSVTLRGLTIRQTENPEPPVAVIPRLHASVHWRELFSLHLVADFLFDAPRLHVDKRQLLKEARDETPVRERGWQQALEAIYPLKINLLRIRDAEVLYIDDDPGRPLVISHLNVTANNIRNIHSKDHVYPSPVVAEGVLFEKGHGTIRGHANFLAEPFPGLHVLFDLKDVPLDYFRTMVARANMKVKGGILSTNGEAEYSPSIEALHVRDLSVRSVSIDYVHSASTAAKEHEQGVAVKAAAKEAVRRQDLVLKLDRLRIKESEFAIVNKARPQPYRVFFDHVDAEVTNLSNHFENGPAKAQLTGRFQGSGPSDARMVFRPDAKGPDFDLSVGIRETDMTKMNDLLRSYGKFDVVKGRFSFFTELHVKNGRIDGYVKPLFQDMDVYDARQDAEKSVFRKLYEGLVGGIAKLLENRERSEVATKAEISGDVSNAKTSTWQIITRLVENAFFRAILPGFDRELSLRSKTKLFPKKLPPPEPITIGKEKKKAA
ncbi:MAG TPA: DUF748 domain-containing protein [Thermoanaerobaculia bacterium]|nr:DUF748 domain-containing protein [Thermoanaerobaculia bacterium]